ncbi:MAG: TerB family tellurite resistance protein [Candidatus Hydrogenedentota bacterium]|nr:MAG: TerB family tellurite resistance protein [Candidatus Hydrogenedentota bacterium]
MAKSPLFRAVQAFLGIESSPEKSSMLEQAPGWKGPEGDPDAVAVLMVMAAAADGIVSREETDRMARVLEREYGVRPEEARALLQTAREQADRAIEFYAFVKRAAGRLPYEKRLRMLKLLFDVATADGLDNDEIEKLRSIAATLSISPRDFGRIKGGSQHS